MPVDPGEGGWGVLISKLPFWNDFGPKAAKKSARKGRFGLS
jgi:hypothetical protein